MTENLIDDIPLPGMPEPPLTLAALFDFPVGVEQEQNPCWMRSDDDITHYEDEQSAVKASCDHVAPCRSHEVLVLPSPCWIARAACGKELDADEFPVAHFPTPDMAVEHALAAEFVVVDGVLRCDDGDLCEAKP